MGEVRKDVHSPNLQRGMAILEYLAAHRHRATMAELTERLGFPAASVFRITKALVKMGYLSRDPVTRQFSLTNKMMLVGQPRGREMGLAEASLPAMRALWRETGETVQLCCLVETKTVALEQILASHPFKFSADLGARCPCYSCAPGKAMVAALPAEDREALIERIHFRQFTPTTLASPAAFRHELEEIAACGYAVDRAEGLEGIHCVAAAIRDRLGMPVGALTIAGPASRIAATAFERLGKIVHEAATRAAKAYNG